METSGEPPLGSLADGGRTVFLGNHLTGRILSWPVDSDDPPRLVLDTREDWAGWRVTAWSPTDPLVLAAGTAESVPWVRTVDADGAVREVLAGADVGGEPISAVVLPDGRRARLLDRYGRSTAGVVAGDRGRSRRGDEAGDRCRRGPRPAC